MTATPAPSRLASFLAYALSGATTLLWVGCAIPSGPVEIPNGISDAATPLHREAVLLVPALLLLAVVPVGSVLARRIEGQRAVLAGTDLFVAFYAAIALTAGATQLDLAAGLCIGLLYGLGVLSLLETWRCLRRGQGEEPFPAGRVKGIRVALCILVLLVPPRFLLEAQTERASWLAPFFFVAIGSAGVMLSSSMRGLRLTCAALQLALALHVLVTLRYTVYEAAPKLTGVDLSGQITLWVAIGVVGLAALQALALLRGHPDARAVEAPAASPSPLG